MMAAFRHPGVVEVYDYAGASQTDDEQVAYLVMAFVEGEPLSTRVKKGPMNVAEVMSIVAQAADALHAAHQAGTVHRDVKPGNLIVKPTGAVVLVDFGVARSNAVTSVTAANAIVGTALYMAPEQVAKGNVSAATDIYALGAVAYHCIAGKPPFDGDNALQVAMRHLDDEPEPLPEHVPVEVRELIARAMAKQPGDRFATAAEFAEAAYASSGPLDWKRITGTSLISPLSPAAPTRAVPLPRDLPPALPPPSRRPQRSQTAVLVAVIALLVLAGGLGLALLLNDDTKTPDPVGGNTVPSAEVPATPDESVEPTPSTTPSRTTRPNGTTPRSNPPRSPSASATTTPTRTTQPTTRAPTATTTAPTTPTTAPPTTPTTPPPTTPPAEGTGAGS
jgi:serine/threonine-protein kinase